MFGPSTHHVLDTRSHDSSDLLWCLTVCFRCRAVLVKDQHFEWLSRQYSRRRFQRGLPWTWCAEWVSLPLRFVELRLCVHVYEVDLYVSEREACM